MKASNRVRKSALAQGVACASLFLTLALSPSARAEGNADSDRANQLFKKGKAALNADNYEEALRLYREAWRLKQSPDIAANLAQAESRFERHREAAEHYAFALAHLLPSTTDEQKKALADGLAEEEKEIGKLHITLEPPDSALLFDDVPVTLPPSGDLFVDPGTHHYSVTHEGYQSTTREVQVSKGSSQVLWIKLVPVGSTSEMSSPAPSPPPIGSEPPKLDHGSSSRSRVPAYAMGAVGVAGLGTGIVFLFVGNARKNDADQIRAGLSGKNPCGPGTPYPTQCAALHDKNSSVDSAHTIEAVSFSVAGAALIGTILYLAWPHHDSTAASAISPTMAFGPGGGSVGLVSRF